MGLDRNLTYYISGPMTGYPDFNYPLFEEVCKWAGKRGLKVISPHRNPAPTPEFLEAEGISAWEYYMRLCRKQVKECSGIIMLPGWPKSTGAREELALNLEDNKPVYFLHMTELLWYIVDMNKDRSDA